MKIILHTDGGARGNPGPAGAGVAILDGEEKVLQTAKKFLGKDLTNNEAEYQALIFGLQTVWELFKEKTDFKNLDLEIKLDSELVVKQLRGEYKVKEARLKVLSEEVKNVISYLGLASVTFTHIRREENELADKLANEAMDEMNGGNELA